MCLAALAFARAFQSEVTILSFKSRAICLKNLKSESARKTSNYLAKIPGSLLNKAHISGTEIHFNLTWVVAITLAVEA